ncbi:MAG: hypothetical protein ACE5JS_09135 [Nitrospinota bacterium]
MFRDNVPPPPGGGTLSPKEESHHRAQTPGLSTLPSNRRNLKGNIGNQNYPIPAEVDVSTQGSAINYCKTFSVIFRVASLR